MHTYASKRDIWEEMIEIGPHLYHTAIFFIVVWGITRFFAVLGRIAEGQSSRRTVAKNEPINFTK